jgi:hypothetical protein
MLWVFGLLCWERARLRRRRGYVLFMSAGVWAAGWVVYLRPAGQWVCV